MKNWEVIRCPFIARERLNNCSTAEYVQIWKRVCFSEWVPQEHILCREDAYESGVWTGIIVLVRTSF